MGGTRTRVGITPPKCSPGDSYSTMYWMINMTVQVCTYTLIKPLQVTPPAEIQPAETTATQAPPTPSDVSEQTTPTTGSDKQK